MRYTIGIDLGGTNIKTTAVSDEGCVLDKMTYETGDDGSGRWTERIRQAIASVEERQHTPAMQIGIATPGLPSPTGRSIVSVSGRLQELLGLDWTDFVGTDAKIPVINDAQAALLAEAWCGAASSHLDVLMLTLGTGVGGAIMYDGRIVRGHLGRAGEVGHMSLEFDAPTDSLGIPGSLEAAIGNATVASRSNGRYRSTRDLVDAYRRGDGDATDIWEASVYKLACAIASLINILDPEIIIVGGGIAAAGASLFAPLDRYLDGLEWRPYNIRIPIVPAALGDFAGAMGAARNAMLAAAGNSQ